MKSPTILTDCSSFLKVTAFFSAIITFLVGFSVNLHAQNSNDHRATSAIISVSVSAGISTTIEIETLSNINFGQINPSMTNIYINPRADAGAGVMRIRGRSNTPVRVSFLDRRELVRVGGGGAGFFYFEVSGSPFDNQFFSEPITVENRQIIIGDEGEYYFWIGGRMSLENLTFGQYEGEFTLEIDYF